MTKIYGSAMEAALKQPAIAFLQGPEQPLQEADKSPEQTPGQNSMAVPSAVEQPSSIAELSSVQSEVNEPSTDLIFNLELATKRTYQPSTIIRWVTPACWAAYPTAASYIV